MIMITVMIMVTEKLCVARYTDQNRQHQSQLKPRDLFCLLADQKCPSQQQEVGSLIHCLTPRLQRRLTQNNSISTKIDGGGVRSMIN